MPILLTTPYTHPGTHGQPDTIYTMVQMVRFDVKPAEKVCVITMQYGNVVNGAWAGAHDVEPARLVLRDVPEQTATGINPATNEPEVQIIKEAETTFTDMVTVMLIKASDDGLDYYTALGRDLFMWLIANGYYAGMVV